jgi:hypothetical protein
MKYNFCFFVVLYLGLNGLALGQIQLSYPADRMVYQRNSQNTAHVYIEGSFVGAANRVKARLRPLDTAGQLLPLSPPAWATIASCMPSNSFAGALFDSPGGWYMLEVQLYNGDTPMGNVLAQKVGVGEVFVIAGQSNATGLVPDRDPNLYVPNDMVNCMNAYNDGDNPNPPMQLTHLEANSNIYPIGVTAWNWGVLGDYVANNWAVPVLFFNTAMGNTSIFNWRASANNEPGFCGTPGNLCPYPNLKKILVDYAQKTGLRAVLWHQGENDLGNFEGAQLDPSIYYANMKQVVDKSRADLAHNMAWVIAKVSRVQDATSARVTNGQQMVIDEPNYNCHLGPLSDNIQPSASQRDTGGVHLWGQGLLDMGLAWWNSINNAGFLANAVPKLGSFQISGMSTVKSGSWADPTVWSGGRIPNATDHVYICADHTVLVFGNANVLNINNLGNIELHNGAQITLGN